MTTGKENGGPETEFRLNRHVMARRFLGGPPPFVVDLRCRHMFVPQKLLHFCDIDPGVKQQRSRGGTKRVRGVDAAIGLLGA